VSADYVGEAYLQILRTENRHRLRRVILVAVALIASERLLVTPARAGADDLPTLRPWAADDSGLYLKVVLANPVKTSKLKTGDVVEGVLARDVYSASQKVFSAGSRVKLTVDHLERRPRARNDHWPWVVNAFTPRHETFPVFGEATVADSTSGEKLRASLIALGRMREVHAQAKKKGPGETLNENDGAVETIPEKGKKAGMPTMVLEGFRGEAPMGGAKREPAADADSFDRKDVVAAGTHCKILLLNDVSASRSKPGDRVMARLLEPVMHDAKVVLPAGALIEGKVVKKTPPRMLSRPGSLYLTFHQITLPEGVRVPIAASLAGAELNQVSHTNIDAEGGLHGDRPGAAWMAINIGMTAGIAKEVDDGVQLAIEAIVSTATDASTAGTSRIASTCISGIYLATRHGRDVVLPRFTEMEISLDRPVSLSRQ